MPVSEGAPRSDDGNYWWDGSEWQVVPDDERSSSDDAAATTGDGEMTAERLAAITSEDQLDEKSAPYFQPDYDAYPDDDSDAEGDDVLSDEPVGGAA